MLSSINFFTLEASTPRPLETLKPSFLQPLLNHLQVLPACFFEIWVFQEKGRMQGGHDDYFIFQSRAAEVIEIIEAAAQLKK